MRELKVTIKSTTGLDARPTSVLVNAVPKFKSTITVKKQGQKVNLIYLDLIFQ